MFPLYDAQENLDGLGARTDNTQDAAAASAGPADTYNPTRATGIGTVLWLVRIRAASANTDKVYVVPVVASALTAAQVVAQATEVLDAGQSVSYTIAGAKDTDLLIQYAATIAAQAVTIQLFEIRDRRS